jgi:uncharacterized protein
MAEHDLLKLLATMEPELHAGEFVFASVSEARFADVVADAVCVFRETEGITVIVPRAVADSQGLGYDFVAAWITLMVNSALDAVGLTAAFASALTNAGISCNVVAALHHDHLFVAVAEGTRALEVLEALSRASSSGPR